MSNPCPNCGAHHYDNKECRECGYTDPNFTKITEESILVFCNSCGCTYLDTCTKHPGDCQRVEL